MLSVCIDQLVHVGSIGGFGKPALFVQQAENAHLLLDQVNRRLQIESEVHELPVDVLSTVLFLFENEHGVIEQLLEFLVGVINAELLERVQREDFEAGNVENADERRALPFASIERLVDARDNPFEHALVDGFGDRLDGVVDLSLCLRLGDEIPADFQLRLEERPNEVRDRNAQQMADFLRDGIIGQRGLVAVAFLLELYVAHLQHGRDRAKDRVEIVAGHVHDLHGFDRALEFFGIVDARDGHVAVGEIAVPAEVFEQIVGDHFAVRSAQQLVEDVKCSFFFGLTNGTRLLEQVGFDRCASDEARCIEINTNEFTESRRIIIFDRFGISER